MRVISIGTDRKLFDEDSAVRKRVIEYGGLFDELHIVVFSKRNFQFPISNFQISDNVFIYPTNSRNKLFYLIDAFLIIKKIIKNSKLKIKNSRNDIVISCQDPFETGIVGAIVKLIYGLPLHIQIHTDFYNKYFFSHNFLNKIRFLIAHITLPFADGVRVVSEKIRESIRDLNKKVEVLPINVELKSYKGASYKVEKGNSIKVLSVSRLEAEKDLGTAIKAFEIIAKKYADVVFIIVGDGSLRQSLEVLVKSLGVEEKVRFVGWKERTEEYYKDADIYISTSLYEGYGMSMVEAGSFGIPLVISDTGVAGSVFKEGESAFICKQKNILDFADALEKLVVSKDLREKMAQKARESVEKNILSKEEYLTKYKSILESLVKK